MNVEGVFCGKCNSGMVISDVITTKEGRISSRVCKKCGQTGRFGWKEKGELSIGEKIKAKRLSLGLFQSDLEKLAGISRTYVSQIERKKMPVTDQIAVKIARALDMSIDELIGEKAPPKPAPYNIRKVEISFEDPALLKELEKRAKENERTIAGEIIYRLKMSIAD